MNYGRCPKCRENNPPGTQRESGDTTCGGCKAKSASLLWSRPVARAWCYAIPEKNTWAFLEAEELTPMTGARQTINIDLTIIDMDQDLALMVMRSYQKHGCKPPGILLGWKAFLTLCAQRQDFGPQHFGGVPIMVHPSIHPMGRSLLAPSSVEELIEHLVQEGTPLE